MNFDQIYHRAKAAKGDLNDPKIVKIMISSSGDTSRLNQVFQTLQNELDRQGIRVKVIQTGSFGYGDLEPILLIEKNHQSTLLYPQVTPEKASELIKDYLIHGHLRPDWALGYLGESPIKEIPNLKDLSLFNLQNRIALRHCGFIDPEDINSYLLQGEGYQGLSRALQMDRPEGIEELRRSRLRGRGGAGFLTAEKWRICHEAEESEKYVICNAVDSDPKSPIAKILMEGDPHGVLEGMLISAYAIGASHGFLCINANYDLAIQRLNKALNQMEEYGLIGQNILGSTFHSEIEIKKIPPSFVSGEETALLRCLEGKQAMPLMRPPYPARKGLFGKPTLIHHVETFSNVSAIFQKGSNWFSSFGTEDSKGTKVITLSGQILHPYVLEVPFGTTIRTLIEKIGGLPEGKKIKAVQVGGPTGGYIRYEDLDLPLDYREVEKAGSILGSGRIEVIDDHGCAVERVKEILSFIHRESCGKCVFCREGSYQMYDILKDISGKEGKPQDLDLLVEIGEAMKMGSICSLGRTAANPVLSSLKLFRRDYEFHIKEKRCPLPLKEEEKKNPDQ